VNDRGEQSAIVYVPGDFLICQRLIRYDDCTRRLRVQHEEKRVSKQNGRYVGGFSKKTVSQTKKVPLSRHTPSERLSTSSSKKHTLVPLSFERNLSEQT